MREWLKAIREERGLTQSDVAQMVGIAQASYCNFEIGQRRPAVETAKAIADVLDFDWTRFYDE